MTLITKRYIAHDDDIGASALLCPRCGEPYLHHRGVTAYDRPEDARQTRETHLRNGGSTIRSELIATDAAANPSRRRDGMAIQFECENCPDTFIELTIAQHKGFTLLGWRYEQEEKRPTRKTQST